MNLQSNTPTSAYFTSGFSLSPSMAIEESALEGFIRAKDWKPKTLLCLLLEFLSSVCIYANNDFLAAIIRAGRIMNLARTSQATIATVFS